MLDSVPTIRVTAPTVNSLARRTSPLIRITKRSIIVENRDNGLRLSRLREAAWIESAITFETSSELRIIVGVAIGLLY
jgi:hypothetical protein